MRRPHGRTRRGAPAPDAAILCAPLQRNQNAPIFEQRCATHTPGSAEWTHRVACHGRRATSPICSNLSFRHTQATKSIPIVFNTGADPVRTGLVPSLNRPGGNVTGVSVLLEELGPKTLGLLHEFVPKAN